MESLRNLRAALLKGRPKPARLRVLNEAIFVTFFVPFCAHFVPRNFRRRFVIDEENNVTHWIQSERICTAWDRFVSNEKAR